MQKALNEYIPFTNSFLPIYNVSIIGDSKSYNERGSLSFCADIDSVGVDELTQSKVTLGSDGVTSQQILIRVKDNDIYDGTEDRRFAVNLSLLYTDFERVNIISDYVEVNVVDDEEPEGKYCK